MSIPRDAIFTEEEHQAADKFAIELNPYNDPNLMPGGAGAQGPQDFYVAEVGRRWPNGSTLRVLVKNETGDARWSNKIMAEAQTWNKYANLKLDIRDYDAIVNMPQSIARSILMNEYVNNPDIRVVVKKGDSFSCWSYIGTTCRQKALANEPSMQFQFGNHNVDDAWVRATIIHEFGHALAFQHEQGKGIIKWNKEPVYAHFAKQGWDKAQVDANLFKEFTGAAYDQSSGYDTVSIMTYTIKNAWVQGHEHNSGNYAESGTVLSDTDKRGALKQYPVTEGVIIYEHDNFGGDFQILGPGEYGWSSLGIGNDKLSSFEIIGDLTLVLYENSDFTGRKWGFWGGSQSRTSLGSFNDIVSAIKIVRGSPKAIIYSDRDYGGSIEFLLYTGDYNLDKLGIGNDRLSSLRVFSGSSVTLYEHSNFSGASITYTSGSAYVGDAWNDKTSSIRVR